MKFWALILFSSACSVAIAQKKVSDFEGVYIHRHSIHMVAENQSIHGIEDVVNIRPISDKEAQILVETYTHNFHSCQLIGKARLEGEKLVYKTKINKALNRGKSAQCHLSISLLPSEQPGNKTVKVEDKDDLCKLQFCGQRALLSGEFTQKSSVNVKDKN